MEHVRVGVVILNYINYIETERCIFSLIQQKGICLSIVVVDNGSGNQSLECIKKTLELTIDPQPAVTICFIQLDQNVGFAGGMNCGIKYLRENGIEFIFIANSDLCFTSADILKTLIGGYEKDVAVLNPSVVNTDGSMVKPIGFKKRYMMLRMIKSFVFCGRNKRKALSQNRGGSKKKINETPNAVTTGRDNSYLRVCGMGYMLTPDYWKYYSYLYPETFLYNEEYALMIQLLRTGRLTSKSVHTEAIVHKHGASTFRMDRDEQDTYKVKRQKMTHGYWRILRLMPLSEKQIQRRYSYSISKKFPNCKITTFDYVKEDK